MSKITSLLLVLFIMASCKKRENTVGNTNIPIVEKQAEVDTEKQKEQKQAEIDAQQWLVMSIENYFNQDNNLDKTMELMTTPDYYQYKNDAINVDMDVDGSLTLKEFQKKWQNKFDVKTTNFNSGFLISGQDWDHISVEKCTLESSSVNDFIFNVIILDNGFKTRYPRKIKVVKTGNQFLIADVKE